jgi:hypothetical protein
MQIFLDSQKELNGSELNALSINLVGIKVVSYGYFKLVRLNFEASVNFHAFHLTAGIELVKNTL